MSYALAAAHDIAKMDMPSISDAEMKKSDVRKIVQKLGELRLSELQKFSEFGDSKEEIAEALYKIATHAEKEIKRFLNKGGELQLSIPPHIWKVIDRSGIVYINHG